MAEPIKINENLLYDDVVVNKIYNDPRFKDMVAKNKNLV